MEKRLKYNSSATQMIYNNLVSLYNQGKPRDFEIRIDDLTVVHRTNDLKKYYWYQKALTEYSQEVSIILYFGTSRRYDKYILFRKIDQYSSDVLTEQQFQQKLADALTSQKRELDNQMLKSKVKSQKRTILELKQKLEVLQSKKGSDLSTLAPLIQLAFNKSASNKEQNGESNEKLAGMIGYYRDLFGEEIFERSLGIALKVAEHPEIIEEVSEFVQTKIKADENNKG